MRGAADRECRGRVDDSGRDGRGIRYRLGSGAAVVLVVEPDADVRRAIRWTLERAGWTVTEDPQATAAEVAAVIARLAPDAAAVPIRACAPRRVPLLVLVGSASRGLFSVAFQLGATAALSEDVPLESLPVILAAHVIRCRRDPAPER